MRGSAVFRTGIAPGGALAGPWVRNSLWTAARAVPSLDLRFADNKSLADAVTGAQLVTFTRASSGTFVGSDGVLRSAVTNVQLRSEEFDSGSYLRTGILAFGSGSVANAIAAPNGTVTADFIVEDTTTGRHRLGPSAQPVTNGLTYTCSIYAKSTNRNLFINCDSLFNARSAFNLQTGAVTTGTGSAVIQNVGDGWYRCSVTGTATSTKTDAFYIQIQTGTTDVSYTGDGTSGIYLWGAQLEQSATVGEYIPTTSTINSAPRFDHNPTTGESLGLLVEEARTNSIANNTGVGAVAGAPGTLPTNWSWNTSGGASTEVVGTGTENGIAYVDVRLFGTLSTAPSIQFVANTAIAATTGQTWTESFYCKIISLVSGTPAPRLRIVERSVAGSYVAEGAQPFTPGISSASLIESRFTFTRTLANALTGYAVPAILFGQASGAIDITLRIGLPQLEQGAFATSVIPTTTATVTRAADVASIGSSAFTSFYNQAAQTWFGEYAPIYNASATVPANTLHLLQVYNTAVSTNNYAIRGANNSVNQEFVARNPTAGAQFINNAGIGFGVAGTNRKVSFGIDSSTLNISTNGTINTAANNAAALMATHDILSIGSGTGGSLPYQLNGTIKRLTFWPPRLSNEVLQRITQP